MKVLVIFDFPQVPDSNSEDATTIIEGLTMDLKKLHGEWHEWSDYKMNWFIDDAVGDNNETN